VNLKELVQSFGDQRVGFRQLLEVIYLQLILFVFFLRTACGEEMDMLCLSDSKLLGRMRRLFLG